MVVIEFGFPLLDIPVLKGIDLDFPLLQHWRYLRHICCLVFLNSPTATFLVSLLLHELLLCGILVFLSSLEIRFLHSLDAFVHRLLVVLVFHHWVLHLDEERLALFLLLNVIQFIFYALVIHHFLLTFKLSFPLLLVEFFSQLWVLNAPPFDLLNLAHFFFPTVLVDFVLNDIACIKLFCVLLCVKLEQFLAFSEFILLSFQLFSHLDLSVLCHNFLVLVFLEWLKNSVLV